MASETYRRAPLGGARLREGARTQIRVIGALMMRELHTRFGRSNIGYLWLVLEPMILASGISLVHIISHISLPYGFQASSFYASGYITYIAFRNNVNRATSLIEANKPLLYHKHITLTDISIARSILEAIAVAGAMIIVLTFFCLTGLSDPPQRPWLIVLGIFLMTWLSTGFAALITAVTALMPIAERFVHPLTYLMLPITGMFFVLDEIPRSFAQAISWFVIPQISDIVRMGLRDNFNSSYLNLPYIVTVCTSATLLGIFALNVARSRMHFE